MVQVPKKQFPLSVRAFLHQGCFPAFSFEALLVSAGYYLEDMTIHPAAVLRLQNWRANSLIAAHEDNLKGLQDVGLLKSGCSVELSAQKKKITAQAVFHCMF